MQLQFNVFVVLTSIFQLATSTVTTAVEEGIKCYVCNSARDPRCGDPFLPQTIELVDCNQFMPGKNATMCRKNIQKVSLGGRYDLRVVRTCGYESDTKTADDIAAAAKYDEVTEDDQNDDDDDKTKKPVGRCYTRAGTFEVIVTYCSCGESACNAALTLKTPTTTIAAVLLFLLFKQ